MSEHHDPSDDLRGGALDDRSRYKTPPSVDKSEIDFNPPTRYVPVPKLRVGDVVMEAPGYPAVITRIGSKSAAQPRSIYCRYVWQHPSEPAWHLGTFRRDHSIRRAV